MKIDKKIASLIAELEYEIGKQCYNPNSYDGYTGITGRCFRYPVCILEENDNKKVMYKTHKKFEDLQPEQIDNLVYRFGSNYLYIGQALVKVLELLEEEYGLDFNLGETENT